MAITKHRFMVYLSEEDMKKLNAIQKDIEADSWSETIRRMIRNEYKEIENKGEKTTK